MELAKINQTNQLLKCTQNSKQDTLVKAFDGLKIKNYGGFEEISTVLFSLYLITGLNKDRYPTEPEELMLLRFIHANYKSYTLKEIELAFTLAMTRDTLPFMGKNAEVGHYQNFSIEYFCKIMTAYKKYKDYNMKTVLSKQSTFQQIEPPSDKTFLTVNFVNKFKVYLNGGYPWDYGIDIKIFELLVKNGIIAIDKDEKIRVGQEVKKQLKSSYSDDKERKNDWIRLTKKRFFMEYIDNCRKEKVNLLELIEKI